MVNTHIARVVRKLLVLLAFVVAIAPRRKSLPIE